MSVVNVSILTPFKNTSQYLSECLDSVLNQTYSKWEMILVDDHSEDDSFELVSRFAKKDPRIRLYSNQGDGIIHALRTAYSQANANYITRMDSDDIMASNKIEYMLNQLIKAGPGHLATGLVRYFNKDGVNDGYRRYETWLNNLTKNGTNYSEIYKECVIPSPCWMTHRDDFERCGGFNKDRYPEDYDLTFRFYKQGLKVLASEELLHHWRDYPSRTSRTHIHYAQNYFLDIKLHYFLDIDYDSNRPLTVWGAGFKGKAIAKTLLDKEVSFRWICDNPKKIGKHIYGVQLENFNSLRTIKRPQSIVTVANKKAQKEIRLYFKNRGMHSMVDYFFFC